MNEYLSLLIQIPLVGAFMWFVLEMQKRQEKRDELWRGFLDLQRQQWNEFLKKDCIAVVTSLDSLADDIERLLELMTRHDEAANNFMETWDEQQPAPQPQSVPAKS